MESISNVFGFVHADQTTEEYCSFPERMLMSIAAAVIFFIPDLLFAQPDSGEPPETDRQYKIARTEGDISIDGVLDERGWQKAKVISLDYETDPEINGEAPVETKCYVVYSRDHLYVAFKASDPNPEDIRAHFMDRDEARKMRRDDYVGFTIDTFNNEQWAFTFRMNPFGVQTDALFTDQTGRINYSWNAIWESEGRITDDGYVVEARIPFTSINLPDEDRQSWGFKAYRSYPREYRHEMQSHPVNLNNQSTLSQMTDLRGIKNPKSGLNLEVNPVITAKRADQRNPESAAVENGSLNFDPGGNIKWGLKPNLNLNATINPDFSQIESDALRLQENERFVLSYPEKRPFFLEGSEIFDTPMRAVFTRSTINPDAGLKFTGKSGPNTMGTFVTRDRRNRMLFPSNQGSRQAIEDEYTYSEIFRYKNKIHSSSTLGLLAEGRQSQSGSYYNYVAGADGFFRIQNSNTIDVQYLASTTNYSDEIATSYEQPEDSFRGSALTLDYNYTSRNWRAHAGFESVSSDFRNDNGFFPRANYRTYATSAHRVFRYPQKDWLNEINVGAHFTRTEDQSGRLSDRDMHMHASWSGPLQSRVFGAFYLKKRRYQGTLFEGLRSYRLFFGIQPSSFLTNLGLFMNTGDAVDFINCQKAHELQKRPSF